MDVIKISLAGIYPKPYEKLNNVLPGRKCPGCRPWLGSAEPNEECNLKVDLFELPQVPIFHIQFLRF